VKDLLLRMLTYPRPVRYILTRRVARKLFPYRDRLDIGYVDRPHYGYCIYQAARLAALLHHPKISVIEFGCGGGNGLINAEMHIAEVMKLFPVEIELYGFDMGSGLPAPQDYRDIPHYFRPGLYEMDRQSLEQKLQRAKLVIGDVKDTCASFFNQYNPAPIGCVLHDLDFYSSTRDALTLFDADASHFLPRVFMYFDDIIGDDLWLCNEFTGELLAIGEFNRGHAHKKIAQNQPLRFQYPNDRWPYQIFIYHDFEHPKYNDFVGEKEQKGHEERIRLSRPQTRLAHGASNPSAGLV
jgi:hypothetical protein